MKVKTPYCTLHYPEKWKGQVNATVTEEEELCTVVFSGEIAGEETDIFAVMFGESPAMPIGKLKVKGDKYVTVHIDLDMLEINEIWTEEDKELAYAMLDDSNYLLEELAQEKKFE